MRVRREGEPLPSLEVRVGMVQDPTITLSHTLYEAHSGRPVATYPPLEPSPARQQLAFQQYDASEAGRAVHVFGASSYPAQVGCRG